LIGIVSAGSVGGFRRRGLIELSLTGVLGIIVAAIAFVPNLTVAVAVATAIGATASFPGVITISWLQERAEPRLMGCVMSLAMFSEVALDPISFALAANSWESIRRLCSSAQEPCCCSRPHWEQRAARCEKWPRSARLLCR
jgi:hypothetical protein